MDSNVLQYLKDNLYLVREGKGFVVSAKFYKDTGSRVPSTRIIHDANNPVGVNAPVPNTRSNNLGNDGTSKEDYKKFIEDAEIPTIINNGFGGKFFANRYSITGHKAWKNALEEHGLDVLLAATKYYYKQTSTARVMVSNFFGEGIYESFVDDVKKAMTRKGLTTMLHDSLMSEEESSSNMEQG